MRCVVVVTVIAGTAIPPTSGHAATIGVGTINDEIVANGACSLREAIRTVNGLPNGDCTTADPGSNTIMLGAATHTLSVVGSNENTAASGDLDIAGSTSSLTISGAGPGATVVSATGLGDRLVDILAGAPSVTISGLTLTGGHAPDGTAGAPGARGGAINSVRPLTLDNTIVSGNQAGKGGPGSNSASTAGAGALGGSGGGIYIDSAPLTITNSAITNNRAGDGGAGGRGLTPGGSGGSDGGTGGAGGTGGDGGGITSFSGNTVVSATTIAGNAAGNGGTGGEGGDASGGANGGPAGNGGNGGWSGGVAESFGALTLTNATLAGNSSGNGGGGGDGGGGGSGNAGTGTGGKGGNGGTSGSGGGIAQSGFGGTGATLLHITVAGNHLGSAGSAGTGGFGDPNGANGAAGAVGTGAGINEVGAATTLQNAIVSQNSGGNCAAAGNGFTSGTITGVGSSNFVFGDSSCPGTAVDPKLGVLQDNGGVGSTIALLPNSPAVQAVPAAGAGCTATDQRGVTRPQGIACDSGAYEVAAPTATTNPASALTATGATLNGTVTPRGSGSVRFEFGPTGAYGSSTAVETVAAVSARPVSAGVGGLTPSTTYHYRVVVTTADGGSAAGQDVTFTTPAAESATTAGVSPSGSTATGGGAAPPGAGSVLPALTGLKLAPATFAAAPRGSSVQAAAKRVVGTKVSFNLNVAAAVTFRVVKPLPGRRAGGRCVAPTAKNQRLRKCTRLVTLKGSFQRAGVAGTNSFRFTGRLARKALAPGKYRLVATPKGGKAVTAAFRIVK